MLQTFKNTHLFCKSIFLYARFQMLITPKKQSEAWGIPGCCELVLCCPFGPHSQVILNDTVMLAPLGLYWGTTAAGCLEALSFCIHSDANKN